MQGRKKKAGQQRQLLVGRIPHKLCETKSNFSIPQIGPNASGCFGRSSDVQKTD